MQLGRCSNIWTKIWHEPDHGIWEMRGPAQHFTYSKVMAWVAFDRAIKSAETFGLEGPLDDWRKLRDEIYDEVCERGFNKKRGTFVQAYGSDQLDASLLHAALRRLPACRRSAHREHHRRDREAPHARRSLSALRTENVEDALPPGEGAFLACSFWLVDVYTLQERYDEAEALFGGWSGCATMSACSARNTIPSSSAWSAISRRPSRIWRWSTAPIT